MTNTRPLVLDIDGTLLKTDMLYEAFWAGMGQAPFATLRTCFTKLNDRAALKRDLAELTEMRFDLMPVEPRILEMARDAQAEGREVVLASASDARWVDRVAEAHGVAGDHLASDGTTNLRGDRKADALIARYGEKGFDYAGNEAGDAAIWKHAHTAIVVGDDKIAKAANDVCDDVMHMEAGWSMRGVVKSMRPHQWVKNVLLFLPAIAAHQFDLATLFLVLLGMAGFSAAASAIYLVNDLLDLDADRLHATKHKRPFASGLVPPQVGMATFIVLSAVALGIGLVLGPAMLGVIVIYMTLSLAYSLRLKRMRWVDIATLASLYTLRVVAGAAATQVDASAMMLIFIFPIFITLGCVKRLTELALATNDDRLPGRGYGRLDRGDLLNVAGLGIVGALLVFFLYSFSAQAIALYPTRWILWAALVPIAIWLIRMVVLGRDGKQDYDPIVFAMKDKMGLGILMITLSMMFYAAGLWAQWFGLS